MSLIPTKPDDTSKHINKILDDLHIHAFHALSMPIETYATMNKIYLQVVAEYLRFEDYVDIKHLNDYAEMNT